MFCYHPEEDEYFELWFNSYSKILKEDDTNLSENARVCLLICKLGMLEFYKFSNLLSPKSLYAEKYSEMVKLLKALFLRMRSLFMKMSILNYKRKLRILYNFLVKFLV